MLRISDIMIIVATVLFMIDKSGLLNFTIDFSEYVHTGVSGLTLHNCLYLINFRG